MSIADLLVIVGATTAVAGVSLLSLPAALIVAGVALILFARAVAQ